MCDACMPTDDDQGQTWLDKRREDQPLRVLPEPSRDPDDTRVTSLTRDVAFNRHSMNDGEHVSPTDNGEMPVGTDNIRVALAQGIDEEAFKKTLSMATRATIGFDMEKALPGGWEQCAEARIHHREFADDFRRDKDATMARLDCSQHEKHRTRVSEGVFIHEGLVPTADWEEMLKGGLQTALETQTIVFAVSGVSRTATHQLVRSRRASFHQQSQRAGYMGDAPECRMPESIWVNKRARAAFLRAVIQAWSAYRTICDEDISYQDARFVLPEGTTNFILLEYPVREFLNVYAYRGCSMFQWEIVAVMRKCRAVLIDAHPWLEPYIKISCEKTGPVTIPIGRRQDPNKLHDPNATATVEHHCTFQGWEDVEGQCDFPWAKHEARTFKPEFHRISRKDGE